MTPAGRQCVCRMELPLAARLGLFVMDAFCVGSAVALRLKPRRSGCLPSEEISVDNPKRGRYNWV
jgi:hypothetical protein